MLSTTLSIAAAQTNPMRVRSLVGYTIVVALIVLLFFPHLIEAAALYTQDDVSQMGPNGAFTATTYNLGTNGACGTQFTGVVKYVSFYFGTDNDTGGSNQYRADLDTNQGGSLQTFSSAELTLSNDSPAAWRTFTFATPVDLTNDCEDAGASTVVWQLVLRLVSGANEPISYGSSTDVFANAECAHSSCGSIEDLAFILYDTEGEVIDTTTRVVATEPDDLEVIATSTSATIGGTVYINPSEFDNADTWVVRVKYIKQSDLQAAVTYIDGLATILEFPISVSGESSYSTSTPVTEVGRYTMVTQIRKETLFGSVIDWLGYSQYYDPNAVVTYNSTFVAATTTAYDNFIDLTAGRIDTFIASSTISMSACTSWTSFSLGDCLDLMFIPQSALIADIFTSFRDGFLRYAPFGYVTRMVDIVTGDFETELPSPSYTFASDFPVSGLASTTFAFSDVWGNFFVEGSALNDELVSDHTGKNVWEIFEPFFQLMVLFALGIKIFNDLTNFMEYS